jgi:signal transduction histidine kinase
MLKIESVTKNSMSPPTEVPTGKTSPPDFRKNWREERAYRNGTIGTRLLFVCAIIALFLNIRYASSLEVMADVVLLFGCVISLVATELRKPERYFVWWPAYLSFFLAILPSTYKSGGLESPWFGTYMASLLILGTVIQTRTNSLYNVCLVLLNVVGWTIFESFYPITETTQYPVIFMGLSNTVILTGIGYFLYSLIRTEKDLTAEFEKQYRELFETRANLLREESANQAKTDFLANISHELRTPLGAVLGYAQLLQDKTASLEEKHVFAQTIERNGAQLARLVDDLLDLAKVEAGEIELENLNFKITDLIAEVLELFVVRAREKNIMLDVKFLRAVPETVRTDPYRFKQILINVMGNALKFTDAGNICLSVDYLESKNHLSISVRDTGRGIAKNEVDKLFKRFSQADASMTRKYGGTGLGLNFSRQLAHLLGGDLQLTWSELGVGSEFTVALPVIIPQSARFIDGVSGVIATPLPLHGRSPFSPGPTL